MVASDHIREQPGLPDDPRDELGPPSLLAVLVGVLGVMNTMLMTVFERTQEICIPARRGLEASPGFSHDPMRIGFARFSRRSRWRADWGSSA